MEWFSLKEDELPKLGQAVIVTVFDHCRNRKELRYPVYYMRNPYADGYCFYISGCEPLIPEVSEVLAWMPMPNVWDGEYESNLEFLRKL